MLIDAEGPHIEALDEHATELIDVVFQVHKHVFGYPGRQTRSNNLDKKKKQILMTCRQKTQKEDIAMERCSEPLGAGEPW